MNLKKMEEHMAKQKLYLSKYSGMLKPIKCKWDFNNYKRVRKMLGLMLEILKLKLQAIHSRQNKQQNSQLFRKRLRQAWTSKTKKELKRKEESIKSMVIWWKNWRQIMTSRSWHTVDNLEVREVKALLFSWENQSSCHLQNDIPLFLLKKAWVNKGYYHY